MSYEQARVLDSLAARAAIADLSVRQLRAFEAGDLRTWLGTFLVEGVLELAGGGGEHAGHPALTAWFAGARRDLVAVAADSVVEVDRVRASQSSRVLVLDAPMRAVIAIADVTDVLVFERGRWYFSRRRVAVRGD